MNGKNGSTPPITYPELEIRGKTYIMKMARNATYRLENYGLGDFGATMKALHEAGKNIQITMKLAACLLGTETKAGLWKPISFPGIELDELPETLSAELMDRFTEVAEKVTDAMRKAMPTETADPSETSGPNQNLSESEKTDGLESGASPQAPTASA